MLDVARLTLAAGAFDTAADRAYYAMFHAAEAALSLEPVRLPRTHNGMHNLFTRHFVGSGRLPKALADDLGRAFELRQTGTYEVVESVDQQAAEAIVLRAEAFVAAVRSFLNLSEAAQ